MNDVVSQRWFTMKVADAQEGCPKELARLTWIIMTVTDHRLQALMAASQVLVKMHVVRQ
jgi:hypothetical protein